MDKVRKQLIKYFTEECNISLEFEYGESGFTATTPESAVIKFMQEEIESLQIDWSDDGEYNMLSVALIMDEIVLTERARRYVNVYNAETYGWKAVINDDELDESPYLTFNLEYEFVQTDRIYDVLCLAFSELCGEDNEDAFYDLIGEQKKKKQ